MSLALVTLEISGFLSASYFVNKMSLTTSECSRRSKDINFL